MSNNMTIAVTLFVLTLFVPFRSWYQWTTEHHGGSTSTHLPAAASSLSRRTTSIATKSTSFGAPVRVYFTRGHLRMLGCAWTAFNCACSEFRMCRFEQNAPWQSPETSSCAAKLVPCLVS